MMQNLLKCEQMKLKRSFLTLIVILIPVAINFMLIVDLKYRYTGYLLKHQEKMNLTFWQMIFKEQSILYFTALLPVIIAMIVNHLFSLEFQNNGWIMTLTKPIKLFQIILTKYIVSLKYICILLILNSITLIIAGLVTDSSQKLDLNLFIKSFIIMLFSSMTIACICLLFRLLFKNKWVSIFVSLIMAILSQNTYGKSVFSHFNIYSFAEYSYRASDIQMIQMTVFSCVVMGIIFTILYFNKIKMNNLVN